ncbi:uncharacterized protein SPPG_01572 [Spizellomyces punctatus DAOM BR117]|uniref:Uncharacterized protein n=1 Tax=Spizellomyces punctatus (strain DAOM BR117) TaxID=645134 RepID=A0A0L0HST8_SPIPD|nr:hypothetical protein, variant [Spizellomyces punctatus DAOM BR117]XP_016612176.1 uncharacterized protein SPPG_01572 [Spizellomyces punctatus DAOM BR117]KND04136.1 hypothetical protein, variant [Spizellomyces punctatus DAOM BR117]KND04137.1 hypothetical protein SPPG_01572 [Spizellomyces punctatus DAOM BR117]|eukprot:XP_016612175.1 hypothetical protein, variant [Spizellomyces punctatus DAOM BR117]
MPNFGARRGKRRFSVCNFSASRREIAHFVAVTIPLLLMVVPITAEGVGAIGEQAHSPSPSVGSRSGRQRPSQNRTLSPTPTSRPSISTKVIVPEITSGISAPTEIVDTTSLPIDFEITVTALPIPASPPEFFKSLVNPHGFHRTGHRSWLPETTMSAFTKEPATETTTPLPTSTAISNKSTGNTVLSRPSLISIATVVPLLVIIICALLGWCFYRRRIRARPNMASNDDDTKSLTYDAADDLADAVMVETIPTKTSKSTLFGKMDFRSVASSVETGLHTMSSSISSIGSSWRGRMKLAETPTLPDILRTPQSPLAFLSPHSLDLENGQVEPDLVVQDYILCLSRSSCEDAVPINPFADVQEINTDVKIYRHLTQVNKEDSVVTIVNVEPTCGSGTSLQTARLRQSPPRGERAVDSRKRLSPSLKSPPPAILCIKNGDAKGVLRDCASRRSAHGPGPMAAPTREERRQSGRCRSMSSYQRPCSTPSTIDGDRYRLGSTGYSTPLTRGTAALNRCPSNSSTCTKATTATGGSGSSAASRYLCRQCLNVLADGCTKGTCKACLRDASSDVSVISVESGGSEGSLSNFL